jgi:urease accessory protein
MQMVRRMAAERSLRPQSEQAQLLVERYLFLKRRWKGVAEDGAEFEFDLESRLKIGCVVHQTEEADYVIVQKPETVDRVETPSAEMAALVGWKIGNLHFPVQIIDGFVLVMIDPMVRTLLDREQWRYEEVSVVFQPLKLPPEAILPPPAQKS